MAEKFNHSLRKGLSIHPGCDQMSQAAMISSSTATAGRDLGIFSLPWTLGLGKLVNTPSHEKACLVRIQMLSEPEGARFVLNGMPELKVSLWQGLDQAFSR
jgi:hypothetical protein